MTDQPGFVAPAGWYVDPTTSLHLRWWSGLAWTEHVAAIPEVAEAPADFPEAAPVAHSTANQANAGRADVDATSFTAASAVAVLDSDALRVEEFDVHAAVLRAAPADGALPPPPVPRIAPVSSYGWERETVTESAPLRTLPVGYRSEYTAVPSRWSSVSVWVLAFTPWISVAAFIMMVLLEQVATQTWVYWGAVALPWLIIIAAAQRDVKRLRIWGHQKLASWAWALLGAPAYLIARTVVLRRNTGIGSAPLWVWIANFLLVLGLCAFVIAMFSVILAQYNNGLPML